VRRFAKQQRLQLRTAAPQYWRRANARPHRKAQEWAAFHVSGSRIIFLDEEMSSAIVAHFIVEEPNP
jgi:hypothetical protein